MLADQLVKKDRKSEAIEQLQTLYNKFTAEGRTKEARATVDRMKAIDGTLEPTAGATRATPRANDLIFLDVDYDSNSPAKKGSSPRAPEPEPDGQRDRARQRSPAHRRRRRGRRRRRDRRPHAWRRSRRREG